MCIAHRKRAIPHLTMKTNCNMTCVFVMALCNQPEAISFDLGDDQSRQLIQFLQLSCFLLKMLQFDIWCIAVRHLLLKLYTVKNSHVFGPPCIVLHALQAKSLDFVYELDMGQMSDYDIRPKLKVWTGSLNECRTFGRTSAKCYASMSVFYR